MEAGGLRLIRKWAADSVAAAIYRGNLWAPYLRMRNGSGRGALILTFHRLVDDDSSYLRKGPTVQTHVRLFEEALQYIRRHYHVVSLNELVDHLLEGRPFERRTVAVTFDDGYEDNHRLGMPLCARYEIPATLFVTTGCLAENGNGLFWNDRLEQALMTTRRPQLDTAVLGIPEGGRLELDTHLDRIDANIQLGRVAKGLPPEPRDALLTRLEQALEVDTAAYRRSMLTWQEVCALDQAGWEIGTHGVSHTILTLLSTDEAVAELRESKEAVEERLGKPVRHFAYPNGRAEDFNDTVIAACADAGYVSAASCINGVNRPGGDPFCLLRVGVTWTMARTAFALERHFMVAG